MTLYTFALSFSSQVLECTPFARYYLIFMLTECKIQVNIILEVWQTYHFFPEPLHLNPLFSSKPIPAFIAQW